MAVDVAGLVVLIVFYVLILVVGVLAAWRKQKGGTLETSIVADRDINVVVGIFTMTATIVGGGYVNGSAESVAKDGLAWTLPPFGIFLGLIIGGLFYAKPMRDSRYMTMLDPVQEQYGRVVVFLVYLATLCGDVFWTSSILSALGTSLSVIININLNVAIVTSAAVTTLYTMIGQMISVAYTDIIQLSLILFGLVLSIPFVFTNDKVGDIETTSTVWLGEIGTDSISPWIDLFIAMIFGTIPWQSYFQRVLSVKSGNRARALSIVGAFFSLILVIPSVFIGAASTVADWNSTSYGVSPVDNDEGSMVLPLVLKEFTPKAVSIIGLGAISAAVMSSMDSSILGSSSMFTYNVYKQLFRQKASDTELLWIQRASILVLGAAATAISTSVTIVFGLFVLAGDFVSCIVFPQLTSSLFFKFTNSYGAIVGFILSLILRLGAGEYYLNFTHFIEYPWYDEEFGQIFPFRIFSMVVSFLSIFFVSVVTNLIFHKGWVDEKYDFMNGCKRQKDSDERQKEEKKPVDTREKLGMDVGKDLETNNYIVSHL